MTRYGLMVWAAALALAGCVMGPNNGTAVDGSVIGAGFSYYGYTNTPSELITLEVMVQPDLDPGLPSSWTAFGTATASASPTIINDPTPLYAWSAFAAPVPSAAQAGRWAPGGVVRTRARRANGGIIATFDEPTFFNLRGRALRRRRELADDRAGVRGRQHARRRTGFRAGRHGVDLAEPARPDGDGASRTGWA